VLEAEQPVRVVLAQVLLELALQEQVQQEQVQQEQVLLPQLEELLLLALELELEP
jgi:hypothetical protein